MKDCRLQVRPYTWPHPEIAVAAMVTPSGPRLAGQHNASLLSLSMQVADGFAAVGKAWEVVTEQAEKVGGPTPDRKTWRILGTMHIAETRDQAIDDCLYGLRDFANYFGGGAGFVPLAEKVDEQHVASATTSRRTPASPSCVIGTPDDAIEYIEGLIEQSGGFGTFLMLGHDWAIPERTQNCYRLFAEKVMPHFQGHLNAPRTSHDWATAKRGELFGRAGQAMMNAIQTHVAGEGRREGRTEGQEEEGDAVSGCCTEVRDDLRQRRRRTNRSPRPARCWSRCAPAASAGPTCTSPSTARR